MNRMNINDVEKMYEQPVVEVGDKFKCPVCGKTYKTLAGAEKHLAKKECADLKAVYKNTIYETEGYKLYRNILGALDINAHITFALFRKSRFYNGTMRLMTMLNLHTMTQYTSEYAAWLLANTKHQNKLHLLFKYAVNEDNMEKFKIDLHATRMIKFHAPQMDAQRDFFIKHPEEMLSLIRKCQLSIEYVLLDADLMAAVDRADPEYHERFVRLAEAVIERRKSFE